MAAAVTGHLMLSTIHTVDAPGAITRLLNMGVPPYLVAGGLAGVVAQRLARRVCAGCRGRASRCGRCTDGYCGRIGVFQVLVMTDALRDEVVRGASTVRIRGLAQAAGMGSLAEDARPPGRRGGDYAARGRARTPDRARGVASMPRLRWSLSSRGGRLSLVRAGARACVSLRHAGGCGMALLAGVPAEAGVRLEAAEIRGLSTPRRPRERPRREVPGAAQEGDARDRRAPSTPGSTRSQPAARRRAVAPRGRGSAPPGSGAVRHSPEEWSPCSRRSARIAGTAPGSRSSNGGRPRDARRLAR